MRSVNWPEVDFENLEDSSQPRDKSTDTETVGPPPPLSLAEVERQLPASPDEGQRNSPTEASEGHSVLTSTLSPSLFKFNSPDFVPPSEFLSSFLSPVDVVEPPPEFADTNVNPSSSSPSAVADPVVGVMPVIASFVRALPLEGPEAIVDRVMAAAVHLNRREIDLAVMGAIATELSLEQQMRQAMNLSMRANPSGRTALLQFSMMLELLRSRPS
jgi:hypothetical protein